MFGVPGQTAADWRTSLHKAIELEPLHLSIYNLIYENDTPFHNHRAEGILHPLKEKKEELLYNIAIETLEKAGFDRYENSSYCKPGFECVHNLGYWNYTPYLGFGPSAHSFDGKVRNWNVRNLSNYLTLLKNGKLPIQNNETITKDLQQEEWIFLQMYQTRGLNLEQLCADLADSHINWIELLNVTFGMKWRKLLVLRGHNLSFTNFGFWLSDEILPKLINLIQSRINIVS